jgi:hypothetical protein
MSEQVISGAVLRCTFGTAPASLNVSSQPRVMIEQQPAASVVDYQSLNAPELFGICNSPSNPIFMSTGNNPACTPNVAAGWQPGAPNVLIGNFRALNSVSTCICMYAQGTIAIQSAKSGGATQVMLS